MRLAETERRVMTQIWPEEGIAAKKIVLQLREKVGWNKATTYTVINRCIGKGYIRKEEPGFKCYSLISHEEVTHWETDELLADDFEDRPDLLVASLVSRKKLTRKQIDALYELLDELKDND